MKTFQLARAKRHVLGRGYHRSGWPYAYAALAGARQPLLVEDFVEQRFCYAQRPEPIARPWVGIFHHPPNMPRFASRHERPQVYLRSPAFGESRPWLVGAVALSEYLAVWFRERLQVPVLPVKHPSEIPPPQAQWSPERFRAAGGRVVQAGWYLRNTRAIHQLLTSRPRLRLWQGKPHQNDYDAACARRFRNEREEHPGAGEMSYCPPGEYDRLLASSLVLTELLDASANNVVIECVARSAPLLINRHPAAVEYLGANYPLFYGEWPPPAELLEGEAIVAAHDYLKAMDKAWLDGGAFARTVIRFLEGLS